MSASIELIAESPESPGCKRCGPRQEPVEPPSETDSGGPLEERPTNGADVAVTLFLPGVGNGVLANGRIDYTNPTDGIDHAEQFEQLLAAQLAADEPTAPCCRGILYRAHYDPFESAYANAEELTELLWTRLETITRKPWVRKIYLHLLGFSAGGTFVAFVSSRAQGDTAAGDRDPSEDDRLRDEDEPEEHWSPLPVELGERLPGTSYSHDEVPKTILGDDTLGAALTLGCRCVTAP